MQKNEKEFEIPVPGENINIGAKLYGELDKPMVIFVHGLTGFMDEHQFYNGARYFYKHGFSSLRFDLYSWGDDKRKLVDCTLKTHAKDIDTVIDYLRKQGVQKIFAAGHSYGFPSILLSSQEHITAISSWDGTDDFIFDDAAYIPELDIYKLNWGPSFLLGRAMHKEAESLSWDALVTEVKKPIQFIWASEAIARDKGEEFYEKISVEKNKITIQGADHTFSVEGTAEQMYDETLNWFKKFL